MFEELFPEFAVLAIPLRNKFRGINTREVAIFRGCEGWSEFGPFLEYDDRESATWLQAALEAANNPWPTLYRNRVEINATLPIVEPEQVAEILARFPGSTTVKIKVDDFEHGALVLEEVLNLYPEMKIRLDVNGGWDQSTAISNLVEYHLRFGNVFDYVEQPCVSINELAAVKAETPIRIAVDESIRKNLNADFPALSQVADVAILKWQPVGGFAAAHSIADKVGLPVVVSSALETGIGISHGLALAASFAEAPAACGLGTVALFAGDICNPAVLSDAGFLEVKRREPEGYERYLAPAERVSYWKERILRTFGLLEGLEV
jgi:O-succinylbenzoate synthase